MRSAALLLALLLAGCAAPPLAPTERACTLVLLKAGPMNGKLGEEETRRAFAGHFENMGRLARERKLLLAGPFGKARHDPALRGLFVLDTGDRAVAEAWAATDPTTAAGVFTLEFHDLATEAPIDAVLERDLEREARAKAEGRTPGPGEGARPYVLLVALDRKAAFRELSPLAGGGGALFFARMDGTRAVALLDAKDTADAKARFGPVLGRIGTYVLDDWYATEELARMGEQRAHP